jgi:NAD(P)-dependent dehydrogenase (short-subunit alcohol dehydrogenase family)
VVTGAGSGIGAATAQRLGSLGATVVLCGRRLEALKTTAAGIVGGRAVVMPCDITQAEAVKEMAAKVEQGHGRLDFLINCAGVRGPSGPLHELNPDAWDTIFETNLRGAYLCIRSFVPLMIRTGGGQIINISSLAGKNPLPNGAAYAASKWALNGLSYSIAEELRGNNIRVSVICPGSVNTPFSPHTGQDLKRMLQPEDVAHTIEMLVTQRPQSFASEILLRPTLKP